MLIRFADKNDYTELALMKWEHAAEDDTEYGEKNIAGADKDSFVAGFEEFLQTHDEYMIFVAEEGGIIVSAMFVCLIPKLPKPNGQAKYIAYLTNVFTKSEFRGKGIGTKLLTYIKEYLTDLKCELLFAWPSERSVSWYSRNGFCQENDIAECLLTDE